MKNSTNLNNILSSSLGFIVLCIGIANLVLVHPVPGIIGILLSLLFFPPVNAYLRQILGFAIPLAMKILLFLIIAWFTMGISDLGEILGF